MRIDERGILVKCQRNNSDLQPMAIDKAPAAPTPDFSQWHNPSLESYKALDVWTSGSPIPNKPSIVILGSGEPSDGDIRSWLYKLTATDINVICIDHWIGGYEHDWSVPKVNVALCELVASQCVLAVYFAFPCGAWSSLHCLPGPPMS